ncbi:MAG: FtsW/RodA/SpoVE family cell cycle protein [Bacilli bacterium]
MSHFKVEKSILIPLILLSIISIITIYSAQSIIPSSYGNVFVKQIIWFIIGFGVAYGLMGIGNNFLYKNIWFLYGIVVFLLVFLLIAPEGIAKTVNGSTCWFNVFGIGTIQPSEFMKVILIIAISRLVHEFNEENFNSTTKDELKLLLKVGLTILIPSILTFMQPDTGVVIIYFVIALTILFVSGIRYRWFILLFSIIFVLLGGILIIHKLNQDLFINMFGTNLFYRIDRLLFWQEGSGMQLQNALASIGSSGLFGHGFNVNPIYFPEAHTDFIFSVLASNFGLFGSIFFIGLLIFFNLKIISMANKNINNISKYMIAGIFGMLIYQQIQSIGMVLGLLPIIGITLPFISYGGSSLLSYMIIAGIIFNISNETIRFKN